TVSRSRKTRCRSRAPSRPSTSASISGSRSPAASAPHGRQVPRRFWALGLPRPVSGAVFVTVDPSGYRLDGDFAASRPPPQVAVDRVDALPRRPQAAAFEVPNAPGTQPHLLDRTERVAGLVEQGMITRVIEGLILEMAMVQRLADPPRQGMDRF